MFCPNCGTQNADNATFCAGCGTKLNADQQAPAQQPVYEAPVQPQQPVYQQPVYQAPQQPVYQQPITVPGKGLGVAGMVLGIISLVFCCCTLYISVPCAVIGLILSAVGMSKAKKAGMKNGCAVAGIVCSCIALALTILVYVLAATIFTEFMNELSRELGMDLNGMY